MRFQPPCWHETLPSTSSYLRAQLEASPELADGTVIAARTQTRGRGRQGRTWHSTPNQDLAFSFLLRTDADPVRLGSLAMAAALAVADTLAEHGLETGLKWPNDVLAGDRKIAGILVESSPQAHGHAAIVGIGVNINMSAADCRAVNATTTSLAVATDRNASVEAVLAGLLEHLETWIERWERAGFAGLRTAWEARSADLGTARTVRRGAEEWQGRVQGFGAHGELLLLTADRGIVPVWSADTTPET